MEVFIMSAQLLLGLSILVILHEWGHYAAARAFGIRVEKFYLFFDAFGVKLFKFRKGDTEYGIGWLPLGGYVKISGMIDESMDKEQMKRPSQPWEFRSKPAWQRLIVMLGGITVNTVLGVLIFWLMTWFYGERYLPVSELKYGVTAHPIAEEIGFRDGDRILAVNHRPIERFSDVKSPEVLLGDATVTVLRDGQEIVIHIPPDFMDKVSDAGPDNFLSERFTFFVEEVLAGSNAEKAGLAVNDRITAVNGIPVSFFDEFRDMLTASAGKSITLAVVRNGAGQAIKADVTDEGTLGFRPGTSDFTFKTVEYGIAQALAVGMDRAWSTLRDNVRGFGKIIRGEVAASKAIQGPIGIAKIYGGTWDWQKFWVITGLLSLVLAFMNLLPIPALDGGHTMFLLIEMAKGSPLSDKFMEKAQIVGFAILVTLMVFVFWNDIWKIAAN